MGRLAYANNFEHGVDDGITIGGLKANWSRKQSEATPSGKYGKFLGRFGNDSVDLELSNLPTKGRIDLQFKLFIIQSWDGNNPGAGPDIWRVESVNRSMLLDTTFSNSQYLGSQQSDPLPRGAGDFHPRMGALEVETLGYPRVGIWIAGDSVYQIDLSFDFSVDDSHRQLTLRFTGEGLEGSANDVPTPWANESWGLDDVVVVVTPA